MLILGSAAAGTALGAKVAAGPGALTGAIVGAILGAIAAGTVSTATLAVSPDRKLHLHLEFK